MQGDLSVVIPFIMRNQQSLDMLEQTLYSVYAQEFIPKQIIISDDSPAMYSDQVNSCLTKFKYANQGDISLEHVYNFGPKGVAPNSNNGLKYACAEWVHIMHADDFIMRKELYSEIMELIANSSDKNWFLLSGAVSNQIFHPQTSGRAITSSIVLGLNCVGGPSGIIFKNSKQLSYNEAINNFCDIDFAYKCFKLYGEAATLSSINIFYGVGDWQVQKEFGSEEIGISELGRLIRDHEFTSVDFFRALLFRKPNISQIYIHTAIV